MEEQWHWLILEDFQSHCPGHKDRSETNSMSSHGCFWITTLGFHGPLLWLSSLMGALRDLRLLALHRNHWKPVPSEPQQLPWPWNDVLVEMSPESPLYNWSRKVPDKTKRFMAKPGASACRISALCRDTGRFTVPWPSRHCCSWGNTHTRSYLGQCYAGCAHAPLWNPKQDHCSDIQKTLFITYQNKNWQM